MSYNDDNAHVRDGLITFDPGRHVYSFDGSEFESVTTVVDGCFAKFDAEYWAERKSGGDPVERQRLIDLWAAKGKEARDLGTMMHERIEQYYLGDTPSPEAMADQTFARFMQFESEHRLNPYRTEWRIFSERYRIAGTLDFLARGDDGRYVIYDWKRSTKVVAPDGHVLDCSYGKTARWPISSLPDTTFCHYALQVGIYRFILAEHYGIDVDDAFLGVFHPELPRHYCVHLPYLRREVATLLESRLS